MRNNTLIRNISLRRFENSDLKKILEIEQEAFRNPWNMKTFKYILSSRSHKILVAEYDRKILGYIILRVYKQINLQNRNEENIGHILNLAISKNYRRKKIGTILVDTIIEYLVKKNVSKVFLEVRKSNFAAIKFYLKFNFKIIDILNSYYEDKESAYLMYKRI